jgi:cytochrome b involved in lipid metabolism
MMTYIDLFRVTIINNKPYRKQTIKNLVKEYYIDVLKCCQEIYLFKSIDNAQICFNIVETTEEL